MLSNIYQRLIANPIRQHVFTYAAYLFFIWFFQVIFVSLITFFHLELKHTIGTIQSWIFDRAWLLIIASKILAFLLFWVFLGVKSDTQKPWKIFFSSGEAGLHRSLLVVLLFWPIAVIVAGDPVILPQSRFLVDSTITSYVGLVIFYLTDYVLLELMVSLRPMDRIESRKFALIISILFMLGTSFCFPFATQVGLLLALNMLFILMLSRFWGRSWLGPMLFVLVVLAPLGALFGLDPIWGAEYAYVSMRQPLALIYHLAIFSLAFAYLLLSRYSKNEAFFASSVEEVRRVFVRRNIP